MPMPQPQTTAHFWSAPEQIEDAMEEIWSILVEVMGENYPIEVPLTTRTTFWGDLAMDQLEFVLLIEELQRRYPKRDFVQWMSAMDRADRIDLPLDALVEFMVKGPSRG